MSGEFFPLWITMVNYSSGIWATISQNGLIDLCWGSEAEG
jgi:hypothetical protein